MLLPNPSWPTLLFWQWINQSHNALVNYSNRNASRPQPPATYVRAYATAVSAAIGVSASLTWLIRRSSSLSPLQKLIVQRFVPLPATSLASTLNVLCMRGVETRTGIEVFVDPALNSHGGSSLGTSRAAARKAVRETAITRAFLPVPLLLIPPCVMPLLERWFFKGGSAEAIRRAPTRHLLLNAVVCTASFAFSLPIALALFPQQSSISVEKVEDELKEACSREGIHTLYFNRGT